MRSDDGIYSGECVGRGTVSEKFVIEQGMVLSFKNGVQLNVFMHDKLIYVGDHG